MAAIPPSERGINHAPTKPGYRRRGDNLRSGDVPGFKTQHNELGIIANPKGSTIELIAANRELSGQRSGLVFRSALPEQ